MPPELPPGPRPDPPPDPPPEPGPRSLPAGRRLAGRLVVPPSKSFTHRHLNLALLARRPALLERPLLAGDTERFLAALAASGFGVERQPERVAIRPPARLAAGRLDCGDAGTMLRFLTASLAALPGHWQLDGSRRLRERPVGELVAALRSLGAEVEFLGREGFAPLEIRGGTLAGGEARLAAGASSQYLSALLMACQAAREPSRIEVTALVSRPYVELTLVAIAAWGGRVERSGPGGFRVAPGELQGGTFRVEGDWSAAAYPAAAAALTGGEVLLEGADPRSLQGDRRLLALLESMGARVAEEEDGVRVGGTGRLRAIEVDLGDLPDQVPTLAALAPFARGTTRITGVPHLRIKESDRLAAMAAGLRRLGAAVEEADDGLTIPGIWAEAAPPADEVVVDPRGDHRIAMSLALAGLRRPGVRIATPGVVAKSYPGFWDDLEGLLGEPPGDCPAEAVHHSALEGGGLPLAEARLTDRQRLGVLLQGAALLALLDHAEWHLPRRWRGARIDHDGQLRGIAAVPGEARELPQELLAELLRTLFRSPGAVAGRGEARRASRALLARWGQLLARHPPDRAVREIFDAAPFLADPAFGSAREGLAGEVVREGRHRGWRTGPQTSAAVVAEPAVAVAEPEDPDGALARARSRLRQGRFEAARRELARHRSPEAALLRAWCLFRQGRLGAARRGVEALAKAPPPEALRPGLADLAVRLYANLGDLARARSWAERARGGEGGEGGEGAEGELVAAEAAWDRGDRKGMDRHLAAARDALADPGLAWRWHQTRGLRAMAEGDGPGAVAHFGRALGLARRRLGRFEAASVWNELAIGRSLAGDLAGAERALLHSLRLFERCDSPRRVTLALWNLAETRLRRGRLRGCREVLERTREENRREGNWRGSIQDGELAARYELVVGRAEAALVLVREVLGELDRRGVDWRRPELETLAARALGWLGRGEEARLALAATTPEARAELEPEERPALWALAGDRERALQEVTPGPTSALWPSLLAGTALPSRAWDVLEGLDPKWPYRAARFVLDAELVAPGAPPSAWVRLAAATFRRIGADPFAARLEGSRAGPWTSLQAYLEERPGEEAGLPVLFADYPAVWLAWIGDGSGEVRVLVGGGGGAEELAAPLGRGRLVLRAPLLDPALAGLFRLALRDLATGEGRPPAPPRAAAGGFVGESAGLRAALARLDRLAAEEIPVLVLGETGTGKELAARRLHGGSRRAGGPFLPVNCAALSETLLLADLFGHARGAFTGADRERAGVFEQARGGTVFLDEVGDLPPPAQGALLRVLQEAEVRRLGESHPRRVDVRVIAATHRDLAALCAAGAFRRDLYYRLRVGSVTLPPLRERGRDVELLAEAFLSRLPTAGRPPRLSGEARARLRLHSWPGNVRELASALRVAAALADGTIRPEHLELPAPAAGENDGESSGGYHDQVEALRRRLVAEALEEAGGNRAEAARRLGLSRQALSYLVRKLGI